MCSNAVEGSFVPKLICSRGKGTIVIACAQDVLVSTPS